MNKIKSTNLIGILFQDLKVRTYIQARGEDEFKQAKLLVCVIESTKSLIKTNLPWTIARIKKFTKTSILGLFILLTTSSNVQVWIAETRIVFGLHN